MDESIQERLREAAEAIKPKPPAAWWVFKYATPRDAVYEQGRLMTYCPRCLETPGQPFWKCSQSHDPSCGQPVLYSPLQQGGDVK